MKESIGKVLVKAIRTGKWVYVTYTGDGNAKKYFWISVEDIEFGQEIRLSVSMYNPDKNVDDAIQAKLYFNKIQTAKILDFTEYDVPDQLLNKLEQNMDKYEWLKYEQDISYLLNYYEECNWFDKDPYQKEHILCDGLYY